MCWYVWIIGNSNQHSKNATRVKCICVKGSVQFNFTASKATPVRKFLDYCRKAAKESSGEYLSVSEWVSLHAVCLTMCVYVFKCLCLGDCVFLPSVSSCWVWVCAKGEFLMLAIAGVVQQGKTRASMMLLWYNKSINDADTMMLLWYSKVQQEHLRCYVSGEVGSWVSSGPRRGWSSLLDRKHVLLWKLKKKLVVSKICLCINSYTIFTFIKWVRNAFCNKLHEKKLIDVPIVGLKPS